jgi:SWI/SNF-related matrix-associated actin-dependent regulator of chromatin subfamily D
MSHTVSGQSWQTTPDLNDAPNFETGEGIPAWSLKIEGRLLEVCRQRTTTSDDITFVSLLPNQRAKDKATARKFSTFIKRMVVELDRDATLYPDGNIVEVRRAACRSIYPL